MTYEKIIEKIHSFHILGSKLGLERMEALLESMGNPQDRLKVIHVAGTNGKGSVSRYICSVLGEGGYRVGLYSSPYLERFTESIELEGEEISKEDLVYSAKEVFRYVDAMMEKGQEPPTEFELITVIAIFYFLYKQADYVIMEVGLGGTGDSTNVVKSPLATVITSISYDHMDYLGYSLEEIAAAKAGIIKTGVPMISMTEDESARKVISYVAAEKQAPFIDASQTAVRNVCKTVRGYGFDSQILGKTYKDVKISMIGMHQVSNAICALTVIEDLRRREQVILEEEGIYKGMLKAVQPGRFEQVASAPPVILDGAHNEAGVRALTKVMQEHFQGKRILLCVGILKDKQIEEMVRELWTLHADVITTEPRNERKLIGTDLENAFIKAKGASGGKGGNIGCISEPYNAFRYVEENKGNYDVVLYAGSLYLIGKIRSYYQQK